MNNKQRQTLAEVFREPTSANVRWADVESLLRALGADMRQRAGSRVSVTLQGYTIVLHRPHPRPTLLKEVVQKLRSFLEDAGVIP